MKNRHYLRHILAITALLFNGEAIYSQTYPIENYLKAAGDYVTIYNGEIELTYSLAQYDNLPYFQGDEFTTGEIIFKGNRYPGLDLHLDLHKDQLCAIMKESNKSTCTILHLSISVRQRRQISIRDFTNYYKTESD